MIDLTTILLASCAGFVGLLGLWYGAGIVARAICDARLRAATMGRGVLMLTYDDGPGRMATPPLLDLLKAHDAKATFFLIGQSAEVAPEVVDRLAADGHTIGWHTHTHRNQWKSDPLRALADVWQPPARLDTGPTRATVFRPPYGKMTLGTVLASAARRLPIITWTHVSGDTHETLPDPQAIVAQVEQDRGGVVLMHDMDRADSSRPAYVLELTRLLLESASRHGWTIATPPVPGSRP